MRTLGLVVLLCSACTRYNPAFEQTATSEGDEAPETLGTTLATTEPVVTGPASADSVATEPVTTEPVTTGPATTDTGTTPSDLPGEPSCEDFMPTEGLTIVLGDPARFGGTCPTGMMFPTRMVAVNDDGVVLETCMPGCSDCFGDEHPLSILPIVVADHLPPMGTCLAIEAERLVLETETRCHWGALTIHDPLSMTAHVIATTRSTDPTAVALDLLGDAVGDPMKTIDCDCSAVVPSDLCCPDGPTPSFSHYTIDGLDVQPGEDAPIDLGDPGGPPQTFRLLQAQLVPTCETMEPELSWAVVATP